MLNTLVLHQMHKKVSRLGHIRTVKNSDKLLLDMICLFEEDDRHVRRAFALSIRTLQIRAGVKDQTWQV